MDTLTSIYADVAVEPPHVVADALSPIRRRTGVALSVLAVTGASTWLAWRVVELHWNPVSLLVLAAELVGVVGGIAVTLGLTRSTSTRNVYAAGDDVRDSYWFAFTVADIVGRTRSADLHRDVRTAVRIAPRWRPRDTAGAAVAAVLAEGPRRLVVVLTVGVGLLVGVAPFGVPPWWAIAGLLTATIGFGASHVVLGRGRLRLGDRIRWSYGAIGEVIERSDVAAHAPRRWRGALAVAVGLSLAVGLRGTSDRWTHGLGPMSHDERLVAMTVAVVMIAGALFTLQTSVRPDTGHLPVVARHLDERTGRQSLLALALCAGTVGLIAGASTPDLTVPGGDLVDMTEMRTVGTGTVDTGTPDTRTPGTSPVEAGGERVGGAAIDARGADRPVTAVVDVSGEGG